MLIRILAALALTPVYAPPATVDPPAIDAVVRAYRDATHMPGVAVAVTRGRDVVHTAGYGRTPDGTRVTGRTPMAVASVSKSMTALAVMQFVDAGRITLDEPVRTYLPEFTMADPRAAAITVRHLLNQSSGMSDTTFRSFSGPRVTTLREAVAQMRTARLAAAPGERFEYHNPNFQVAARVVEVVSGESFHDYMRRHVFEPFGMTDSLSASTPDDLPASARGHILVAGFPVALPEPYAFGAGSGGVVSTAHDMARWLMAQDVSSEVFRKQAGPYGLGWFVGVTRGGAPLLSHDGTMLTFTAYQAVLPDSGYGVAVMVNAHTGYADADALGDMLVDLLEGRRSDPPDTSIVWVDVLLLALIPAVGWLGARGVRRSRRWAGSPLRLVPYLLPLPILLTLHRIVGFLYRGRDISWWQTAYLYPTFVLLLATISIAATAVLAARLFRMVKGRGVTPRPSVG